MNVSLLKTPLTTKAVSVGEHTHRRGERRVAHRVPCRLRASDATHAKGVCVVGQTVNLSANGLAVQVGHSVDEGTAVEVLLPPLDGEPTRLYGTVAHTRRVLSGTFEIGIRIGPEGGGL